MNLLYILVMTLSLYAIRALPMTLIRKPIKSRFLRSFLYYVPYVTLAVMTVPAILDDPRSPVAGALALAVGVVAAWLGAGPDTGLHKYTGSSTPSTPPGWGRGRSPRRTYRKSRRPGRSRRNTGRTAPRRR